MILILFGLLLGADESVNEKIVEFARSKLGQKVGDGQCVALADAALQHSGAGRSRSGPYVWGEELKSLKDIKPGDILQFEDTVLFHRERRKDGATFTQSMSFPHHTAIVARVQKQGAQPVLIILHQNVGMGDEERQVVKEWTINLADKKEGSVKAYHPVADPPAEPSRKE